MVVKLDNIQICRYRHELSRLKHGAHQISKGTRNARTVDILKLFGDSVSCLLTTRFIFVKQYSIMVDICKSNSVSPLLKVMGIHDDFRSLTETQVKSP